MEAAVIRIPEINRDREVEISLGASVRVLKRDMTPRRRGENELGFARRELRGAAERAYGSRQICPEGVRRDIRGPIPEMFARLDNDDIGICVGMRVRFPLQSIYIERHDGETVLDGGEFVLLKAVPGVAVEPQCTRDEFFRWGADGNDEALLRKRLGGSSRDEKWRQQRQEDASGDRSGVVRPAGW